MAGADTRADGKRHLNPAADALAPEVHLLCRCARMTLSAEDREHVGQLLRADLDWPLTLHLAAWHGLRPLLHRHLSEFEIDGVPRAVLVELWAEAESIGVRNRAMSGELVRIVGLLESQGIRTLAYKGPTLALAAYADVGLREFGDLDLLLPKDDIQRARRLLCESGYQPEYPLAPAVESAFLASSAQHHLVLRSKTREFLVELHWKTDPDFPVERLDDERWWAGIGSVVIGEQTVRVFPTEELLFVLCLHGSKHYWSSLGWLVDVAELLRLHPELDWRPIARRCEALGCLRRVALGLHLAERILGARLSEEARRMTEGEGIASLARLVVPRILGTDPSSPASLRLNLALYERPGDRIRHVANTVVSPSLVEWSRWPLPRSLFFLYPALRVARLTAKYVRRAGKGA